jgi:hypothetical protein
MTSAVAMRVFEHVGEDGGAAQPVGVDDGDGGAELRRHEGRLVAPGPPSDDHDAGGGGGRE